MVGVGVFGVAAAATDGTRVGVAWAAETVGNEVGDAAVGPEGGWVQPNTIRPNSKNNDKRTNRLLDTM